jgi:hypothetical protein
MKVGGSTWAEVPAARCELDPPPGFTTTGGGFPHPNQQQRHTSQVRMEEGAQEEGPDDVCLPFGPVQSET